MAQQVLQCWHWGCCQSKWHYSPCCGLQSLVIGLCLCKWGCISLVIEVLNRLSQVVNMHSSFRALSCLSCFTISDEQSNNEIINNLFRILPYSHWFWLVWFFWIEYGGFAIPSNVQMNQTNAFLFQQTQHFLKFLLCLKQFIQFLLIQLTSHLCSQPSSCILSLPCARAAESVCPMLCRLAHHHPPPDKSKGMNAHLSQSESTAARHKILSSWNFLPVARLQVSTGIIPSCTPHPPTQSRLSLTEPHQNFF